MMSFALNSVSAQYWVQDASTCPATDEPNYPGQNCSPDNICGDVAGTAQCYDTSLLTPPTSTTTETGTNNPGGSAGFWLNCYSTDAASSPYCDNNGAWSCNYDSSCYSVNRTTECNDTSSDCGSCRTGYQECDGSITDGDGCEIRTNVSNCDALSGGTNENNQVNGTCDCVCDSGYIDCNDDDGDADTSTGNCEIRTNVTNYPTGTNNHYNSSCTASCDTGYLDCDSSGAGVGNGCEIEDGGLCFVGSLPGVYDACLGCAIDKSNFVTGTKAEYSSMDPLLWGTQYGGGALMELINYNASTTGGIFHVANDGKVGIGTSSPSSMLTVGVDAGSQFLVNGTGVVTAGTWEGTTVGVDYGGTGHNSWALGSLIFATTTTEFGEILKSASSSMLLSINAGGEYEWITKASAGQSRTDEEIQDVTGLLLDGTYDGGLIDISYNDTANTINFDIENNLSSYTNDLNFIALTGLTASSTQGLAFNSTTGEFYLESAYNIPLIASSTEWAEAYDWGDHSSENYFSLNNAPLSVAHGGTGKITWSAGSIIIATSSSEFSEILKTVTPLFLY